MYILEGAILIDNISISLEITPPKEAAGMEPFIYGGDLHFVPVFNHHAQLTRFTAQHKNLEVRLYPTAGKVTINNSLAKYWQGHNHQDLTTTAIENAVSCLSDELHLPIHTGLVKGIEYGCVVAPGSIKQAVNSPVSYKGRVYEGMNYKGLKYGSKCRYTDYSIKGYDKTFEAKKHHNLTVPEGLYRWEIGAKYMRYLHKRRQPVHLYTVADLTSPEVLQYLASDLVDKYHNTIKNNAIDYYELTPNELNVALRMQHVPEMVKDRMPHTYKKDKRLYKEITAKYSDAGAFDQIEQQIKEKCRELINS